MTSPIWASSVATARSTTGYRTIPVLRSALAAGQRMHFTNNLVTHSNSGRIEAIGSAFTGQAEIEFDALLVNQASTGVIVLRNALARFDGGLDNVGGLGVSFGITDIFGDVTNQLGATITLSGNADVTFWDDVDNLGTFQVSAGSTVRLQRVAATGDGHHGQWADLRRGGSRARRQPWHR